jgi:plasmid stability protein
MMPDVLVRNIPEPVLATLKQRAAQHRRSLQQELLSVIEAAAQ